MHNSKTVLFVTVLTVVGVLSSISPTHAVDKTLWTWPTESTTVSQYFGYRHTGLDIDGDYGDDIYAARKGTVMKVQCRQRGYGCQVLIRHKKKKLLFTRYAHMDTILVKKGDRVQKGQVIGTMGATGATTGSGLHFEVLRLKKKKKYNGGDIYRNPMRFIGN